MKKLFLLTMLASLALACNKEPGEGGTSRISGKLFQVDKNVLWQSLDSAYATDKDVYIIYGTDDNIYDDKFKTSYDGSYEFKNLTAGTYTVFAYSRCQNCTEDTVSTIQFEITEKKSKIELEDLRIYK